MNGFLNILKPPGMTSAAVVGYVRRMTGEKRVGHAGTLDPEAAGVLPIMIGRAARLFDYLVDKEKTYVAECAFGAATDTQDATGKILIGDIEQRPSIFSAIKQDGKPLYERARDGEEVEAPVRVVHVESIDLHEETPDHGVRMTIRCGRGTYIRSICDDLGKLTGCPAHMRFLLRAQSGVFTLDSAMTMEEAAAYQAQGTLQSQLLPLDYGIQHMPRVNAPEWLRKQVQNGVKLPMKKLSGASELPEGQAARVYLRDEFWGMAAREGDFLVWKCLLPPEKEENNANHP